MLDQKRARCPCISARTERTGTFKLPVHGALKTSEAGGSLAALPQHRAGATPAGLTSVRADKRAPFLLAAGKTAAFPKAGKA